MTLYLSALCFDTHDPFRVAQFWAEALGWEIDNSDDEVIGLIPNDGTRFELDFCPVPEAKTDKNNIHLDLTSSSLEDQAETVERLIEAGGSHVDVGQHGDEGHIVLADPEGNELCIIEPGNNFLATCGVFGSITCDGSPEVGKFWSAVLDWPLVWDQDEETAIRSPDGTGPFITWGPPVLPMKHKNRLHIDVAPPEDGDQEAEAKRLEALGATRADIGQGDVSWIVMADPDGNVFCILTPRRPAS